MNQIKYSTYLKLTNNKENGKRRNSDNTRFFTEWIPVRKKDDAYSSGSWKQKFYVVRVSA